MPPSNLKDSGAPTPSAQDRTRPMIKAPTDEYPKMLIGSPQYHDTISSVAMMSAGRLGGPQDPFPKVQPPSMRNIPPHPPHAGFRYPPHPQSPSLSSSSSLSSPSSSLFTSRGTTPTGSSLRLSACRVPTASSTLHMMMTPRGGCDGYPFNQSMNRISSVVSFDGPVLSGTNANGTPRPHHHNPQSHLSRRPDSVSNLASIPSAATLSRAAPLPRTGPWSNAPKGTEMDGDNRAVSVPAPFPTHGMEGTDKKQIVDAASHHHISSISQQDNDSVRHSAGIGGEFMASHPTQTQDKTFSGTNRASRVCLSNGGGGGGNDENRAAALRAGSNNSGTPSSNENTKHNVKMTMAAPTIMAQVVTKDHSDKEGFDAAVTLSPAALSTSKKKMRRRSNVVSPSSSLSRCSSASLLSSPPSSLCSSSASSLMMGAGRNIEVQTDFSSNDGTDGPSIPPPPLSRGDSMNTNSMIAGGPRINTMPLISRSQFEREPAGPAGVLSCSGRPQVEDASQQKLPDDDEAAHILLSFVDVNATNLAPPEENKEHRHSMSPKSVLGDIAASPKNAAGTKRSGGEMSGRPTKRASLTIVAEAPATPTVTQQQKKRPSRLTHSDDVSGLNSLHCFVRAELLEIVVIGESNSESLEASEEGRNKNTDKCVEASGIVEEDHDMEDVAGEESESAIVDGGEDVAGAHTNSTVEDGVPSSPSKSLSGNPPPVVPPPRLRLFVGRVGLRCVFCAHLPPRHRSVATMSTFYPKSLTDIYRAVCTWQRVHFRTCSHIPSHVRKTYAQLKEQDKTRGKTRYWVTSAMDIGLRDVDKHGGRVGICFAAS